MTFSRMQQVIGGLLEPHYVRRQGFRSAPLAERMRTHNVPGVGIAVIHGGELAWAEGFGVREAGTDWPVTDRTMFQACSISKPVTAVAVLRLAQEGVLDLDADVNRYLTSWQVPATNGWQPRITLRQLLSHTAATTVHGFPGYNREAKVPTTRQILDGEAPASNWPVQVDTFPGTQFRYSGGGTTIVEQVLMDVLKQPFPELMRDLVLAPLGMRDSTYAQPLPEELWGQAASGHTAGGEILEGRWHVYPERAAAGLWTTPSDLARLVMEIQRAAAGEKGRLLTPETVSAMFTPQPGGETGIGFFLDGRRFHHGGDNIGFKADLTAYQDQGLGVVVMANGDEGWHINNDVVRAVARVYDWPVDPVRDFAFYPTPEPVPAEVAPSALAACAGEYQVPDAFTVHVSAEGDRLMLAVGDQQPVALVPESDTAYHSKVINLRASFDHAAGSLQVWLSGKPLMARRK